MTPCDQIDLFVDGELSAEEAKAFREHLATCETCPAQLHDLMQLERLAKKAVAGRLPAAAPARRPARVPMRRLMLAAVATVAIIAVAILSRSRGPELPGTSRSIEGRLTASIASDWRPYEVVRAGATPQAEPVPLAQLAKMESRGDYRGIAAAYLLAGDADRAESWLDKAPPSPEVAIDRAAIRIQQGRAEEALTVLDPVLRERPDDTAALWNRALALRDLGLDLAAADAFDRVAARGERGWAGEAKDRAAALRRSADERKAAYQSALAAGQAMVAGGPVLTADVARSEPGISRLYFYDAVRTATDLARLKSLEPLAAELDIVSGGDACARHLAAIESQDIGRRMELAKTYAAIAAGTHVPSGRDLEAFLTRARAAGAPDIVLGTLVQTGTDLHLDELTSLAGASGDPWFVALAAQERGRVAISKGDYALAASDLSAALGACDAARIDYRCARIDEQLALLNTTLFRAVEAKAAALDEWNRARRLGDWAIEVGALPLVGEASTLADGYAVTRAYFEESLLRTPDSCALQRYVHLTLAQVAQSELQPGVAAHEYSAAPLCGEPATIAAAAAAADLARHGPVPGGADVIRDGLAKLRAAGLTPGQRALADHYEGRLDLESDPSTGKKLLRDAIAEADHAPADDAEAVKARGYAWQTLAIQAAREGDFGAFLDDLGAEVGVDVPTACVLGAVVDDERTAVAVRDPSGTIAGRFVPGRDAVAVDPRTLVPAELVAALESCEEVAVFARPPLVGGAGLLPSSIAWSFRLRPAAAGATRPPRRLVVANPEPPRALGLGALKSWGTAGPADATRLTGAAATPSRVLREMRDATEIVVHAHGIVDPERSDAALIALSPDADGTWALTAGSLARTRLLGSPVVVLGACDAARTAPYLHQTWSLPRVLLDAGARAVVASPSEIGDADAAPFLEEVLVGIEHGKSAARALRDARVNRGEQGHVPGVTRDNATHHRDWTDDVLVFD